MAVERDPLRDWHRLFGLLLADYFSGSPFVVEVERDLSVQQQLLDVVIVRRGRGRFDVRLPDGLDDLADHNLITFKSHHEALDAWAMKELVGHYVAYRKLVSATPSEMLPEDRSRLYAVCARFPQGLSGQVPWHQRQAGVYDCRWGTDEVRVVVAGELPPDAHNAPLHLFSASPRLVGFGRVTYRQRSAHTSHLLRQLFESFQREGLPMPYTMEDFERDYFREHFPKLTPEQHREIFESLQPDQLRNVLESLPTDKLREVLERLPSEKLGEVMQGLPPEKLAAVLSADQIRECLGRPTAGRAAKSRKPRRKK